MTSENFVSLHPCILIVCSGHSQPLMSHRLGGRVLGQLVQLLPWCWCRTTALCCVLGWLRWLRIGKPAGQPPVDWRFTKACSLSYVSSSSQSPGSICGVFCLALAVTVSALCYIHSLWHLQCDSIPGCINRPRLYFLCSHRYFAYVLAYTSDVS